MGITAQSSSGQNTHTKVFLVTGATGAIGKAIARQLANIQDSKVSYELADLSRYEQIHNLAKRWQGPLHVLINNAACTPRSRQETPEGIEMQFATNVLGYYWLIDEFMEILKASAPARVVNVASYWAGGLDLNDLEFTRRSYDNDQAYRQSKQANRTATLFFDRLLNKPVFQHLSASNKLLLLNAKLSSRNIRETL